MDFHFLSIHKYKLYLDLGLADDLSFDIVNFPFSDCGGPRTTSSGIYNSKLIRFV